MGMMLKELPLKEIMIAHNGILPNRCSIDKAMLENMHALNYNPNVVMERWLSG